MACNNQRFCENILTIDIDMAIANRKTKKSGFTLVEMMVTILILTVVMLGLAGVMADSHKGYNRMYKRIHGDVVNDAYVARLRFDKVCRKARAGSADLGIDPDVPFLQILYYSTPNTNGPADLPPDRYAQFYLNGADLMLDTGTYDPETGVGPPTGTETVARNVTELKFSAVGGKCCQMVMTLLKDGEHSITVTCSSIMHN